jgi:hypothetical protein
VTHLQSVDATPWRRRLKTRTSAKIEDEKMSDQDTIDSKDIIWGARAIGAEINLTKEQTKYLLETGRLPATKIGARWVSTRQRIRDTVLKTCDVT